MTLKEKKSLFSNTGFYFSKNFLQAKMKVKPMFSSLQILFLLSVIQSQGEKIEIRKEKETEKDGKKNNYTVRLKYKKN